MTKRGAIVFSLLMMLSACQPECVDQFDCDAKAKAGEKLTCTMGKCVQPPGGGTAGGIAGGTSGGAGGGGAGGVVALGCGNGIKEGAEVCDDGNTLPADGCESDCSALTNTAKIKGCDGLNAPRPTVGTCNVTPGDTSTLITGTILGDDLTYVGGQILVSAAGVITCAACDCSAMGATATRLSCPGGVVSPGLINSHDHISFQGNPAIGTEERFEHRHDWRIGRDGHNSINNGGNAKSEQIRWAEIRQVMSGTTSIVGATYTANSNPGLLRNLDANPTGQIGQVSGVSGIISDTFPLGDTSGTELTSGCAYPKIPLASSIPTDSAYLPHISEGIETSSNNEFICLSQAGGVGVLGPRTAMVHGIGLKAGDVALSARSGTSLIWSPRSNISLYGDTASIPLYKRFGANIALGTDWTISGSMNLLRELQCADSLNKTRFNNVLSDEDLWKAVTANSADATSTSANLGRLSTGKLADIAIYKRRAGSFFRSVIDAEPADVVMTMRQGKVLYGDQSLVQAFDTSSQCETLSVCGAMKSVCAKGELTPLVMGTNTGDSLELLKMANTTTYPLFVCGTPPNEPSCVPERAGAANVKLGSSTYTSQSMDTDRDGIADLSDNCPMIFNPIRPMDSMVQADADRDGVGDACDGCPLDANTLVCSMFDPNDRDGDGIANATDNCPVDANPSQVDADKDGKGDACDACPMQANPGNAACPGTIYAIKTGQIAVGQRVALGSALVTGASPRGYFLQVFDTDTDFMGRDNSGVFVFQNNAGVNQGDRISIPTATVSVFSGQTQLTGAGAVDAGLIVVSSNNMLPAAVLVNPAEVAANDGGLSARLDGVLVRVENVTVLNNNPDAGLRDTPPINEFEVTGNLRINDFLYLVAPFPAVGQQFQSITGVLELRNNQYKIEPRSAADFVYGPASITSLSPETVFIREGQSATLPTPLTVQLSNPEATPVAINVVSSGPEVLVGNAGAVTVAAGQISAPISLTGVSAGTVTVTATRGTSMRTASVRVVGASEMARLVSLTLPASTVNPGATVVLTATLDIPAASDTVVNLTLNPATFGTIPATVTIPANAVSVSCNVVIDAAAGGVARVTATLGGDNFSSDVTVFPVSATNHIVISEFASRGAVSAFDEFAELYNPTAAAIDISGWKLQTKSATATSWTDRVVFPGNTSLAPRRFWLTANTMGYVTPASGPAADSVWAAPTNGLGDTGVVRLVRTVNQLDEVIDAVACGPTSTLGEGAPLAALPGTTNALATFERKAKATSTVASMTGAGADAPLGNGHDTDVNVDNFLLRVARDPQNSQSNAEP
jgi:large repetitive protein